MRNVRTLMLGTGTVYEAHSCCLNSTVFLGTQSKIELAVAELGFIDNPYNIRPRKKTPRDHDPTVPIAAQNSCQPLIDPNPLISQITYIRVTSGCFVRCGCREARQGRFYHSSEYHKGGRCGCGGFASTID